MFKNRVMEGQFRLKSINVDSHSTTFASTDVCVCACVRLIAFFVADLNIELKSSEKMKMKFPHGNGVKWPNVSCFVAFFCFPNKWIFKSHLFSVRTNWPHENWSSSQLLMWNHYYLLMFMSLVCVRCVHAFFRSFSCESLEIHQFGGVVVSFWIDYWSPFDRWIIVLSVWCVYSVQVRIYIRSSWRCLIDCHWHSTIVDSLREMEKW